MSDNLKSDIINGAFSQMRISGITVDPSASDLVLALRRLEGMANELCARNVHTGYYLEEEPDTGSPSGLDKKYWYSFECILAMRLLSDFGKGMQPDPMLGKNAGAQMSFLYASTANPRQTQYPRRQSLGAGNSLRFPFQKSYIPEARAPNTCATNKMTIGDIDDFIEHFNSYLVSPEAISSFTIEAETGLTIVSSSDTSPDVFYQIQAVGDTSNDALLRVKIVMTTDTGRITTRIINFELIDSLEID
jgi:hypothetical protein